MTRNNTGDTISFSGECGEVVTIWSEKFLFSLKPVFVNISEEETLINHNGF